MTGLPGTWSGYLPPSGTGVWWFGLCASNTTLRTMPQLKPTWSCKAYAAVKHRCSTVGRLRGTLRLRSDQAKELNVVPFLVVLSSAVARADARSSAISTSKSTSKATDGVSVPHVQDQQQHQRQNRRCMRPWFPPFAKSAKGGAASLFFTDTNSNPRYGWGACRQGGWRYPGLVAGVLAEPAEQVGVEEELKANCAI